jgi:hypothetical protein
MYTLALHPHPLLSPPSQPQAPVYNYPLAAMTEERRAQLVRRVTIIQSLPCIAYEVRGDKDKKKEPRECAICMMDYCAGELIKLLPCMHFYHLRCIDDWLMRSLTCPSCMERVDSGLLATLSSGGNHISSGGRGSSSRGGGRSLGFSLRRRRRGQQPSESENPLVSGGGGSGSSSRSSSTSSSREHLTSGGPISWPGSPLSPSHQQSPRGVVRSGSGTIFLPPFPSATSPTSPCGTSSQSFTDLGPPPQISSPPSSAGVFLPHISPPHSPQFPHVTIHTTPCSPLPSHQTQVSTN